MTSWNPGSVLFHRFPTTDIWQTLTTLNIRRPRNPAPLSSRETWPCVTTSAGYYYSLAMPRSASDIIKRIELTPFQLAHDFLCTFGIFPVFDVLETSAARWSTLAPCQQLASMSIGRSVSACDELICAPLHRTYIWSAQRSCAERSVYLASMHLYHCWRSRSDKEKIEGIGFHME